MKKHLFFTLAVLSTGFMASFATADYTTDGYSPFQSPVKSAQESFAILDSNGDGRVVQDEGPIGIEWIPGRFEMMDMDSDGAITYTEYVEWPESAKVQALADTLSMETFAALDLNRDVRIDQEEWVGTKEGFKRWDKNQNGVIDLAETQSR